MQQEPFESAPVIKRRGGLTPDRLPARREENNMENFGSIDEILQFAVEREQESIDFYNYLAAQVESDDMKQVFEEFAAEEQRHREKLEQIRANGEIDGMNERVSDLKIGDYL